MTAERPPRVSLRVSGPLACFSEPAFSVERMSYPWITPSAARGIFEAVLWKPRIRYEIREIRVLSPIRYLSFRRNEVEKKISTRGLGPESREETDRIRQQRNTLALRDVSYVLGADLYLNSEVEASGPDDNHGKYVGIFDRRLAKGQRHQAPYLGCREFVADVEACRGDESPIPVDMEYGWMFYDFLFPTTPRDHRNWQDGKRPEPLLFDARMVQGVVAIPPRDEILRSRLAGQGEGE